MLLSTASSNSQSLTWLLRMNIIITMVTEPQSSGGSEQKWYRLFTRPYFADRVTSSRKYGDEIVVWATRDYIVVLYIVHSLVFYIQCKLQYTKVYIQYKLQYTTYIYIYIFIYICTLNMHDKY